MKQLYNILIFVIIWTTLTIAQKQNSNPDSSKGISAEALKIVDDSSLNINQDSGAVILLRDVKMIVNKDRSQKITFHIIGKIFDEQAKSDYSQIPVLFNSYYEDITLDYAKTINEDKSFIEVSKDAAQIKTYPDYFGYSSYTDKKILAFSLPALDTGKLFEYQITINKKIPVIEEHWFQSISFNLSLWRLSDPYFIRIDPVKTSRFTLSVPEDETFQFELTNIETTEKKIEKERREIYIWEVNDVPSFTYEPGMPYLYENIPLITLSSVPSWREFGKRVYQSLSSKIVVTEQILSKAKELITNVNSDFEKIKALYDYVRKEIDYVQADLYRGGITPHYANEVLRTKYGDCKDQVILLLTLLKSLEIEAFPALISTYSFREHPNYIPTQYFDHLIIFVRSDITNIWLDTTTELTEFPNLHWANQNRFALVLDQQGGEFIKIPLSEAEVNLASFDFNIWPENDSLKGRIVMQSCGAFEDNISSILGYYPKNDQDDLIREIVESYYYQSVAVNKININEPKAKDDLYYQIINISYLESIKDLWQFVFTSNMPLAINYFMIELPFYDNRKYDYRFPYRFTLKGREVFHSPWENASIRNLPENDSIISNHFDFHQKFKKYKDSIEVKWRFTIKNELVLSEEFESFGKNLELWENMILWEIDFMKRSDLTKDNLQKSSNNVLAESGKASASNTIKFIPPLFVNTPEINPDVTEAIQNVFNEYEIAINENDVNRLMNTFCEYSPDYSRMKDKMNDISFSDSILFLVDNVIVLDLLYEYTVATFTMVWEYTGYPDVPPFQRTILSILKKCEDEWKIFGSLHYDHFNNCNLYGYFGENYYHNKEYDKAIVAYKLTIANDSSCTSAYGNLGWIYYLNGDFQNCIKYSKKAVELDSTALYAHYNIALSYLCLGQYEKSKTLYSEIVRYNQELGRALSKGAITDLKNLIESDKLKNEAEFILKEIFNRDYTNIPPAINAK